jgi:membrane-bound acyltransferase YfiQ involved in biofilm formation
MPGYKGHLVGGTVAYLFLLSIFITQQTTVPTMFGWLICSLAGSLFPDVDITSKGQKILFRLLFVLFVGLVALQRMRGALMVSIISFVPLLVHHRGIFHRFWFIALVGCVPAVYAYLYFPQLYGACITGGIFFIVGAYSHIYLDVGFKRMWRV